LQRPDLASARCFSAARERCGAPELPLIIDISVVTVEHDNAVPTTLLPGSLPADVDVVREEYHAELAVMNIGDAFTAEPEEAARAVNHLICQRSVIPSHTNEVATSGGHVIRDARTTKFLSLIESNGYVARSEQTMQFDAQVFPPFYNPLGSKIGISEK